MQCVSLTDDELWRVIAENTNAMSRLVHQQLELDAYLGANDPYKGAPNALFSGESKQVSAPISGLHH
jgi:hypothetical protein